MARKKVMRALPPGWERCEHMQVHGRHVVVGTELRIAGQRGRFRFASYTRTPSSAWIDVRDKDGRWRAFSVDAVRTVHTKKKLRPTG